MENKKEIFAQALKVTASIKARQKAAFFSECEQAEGKEQIFDIAKKYIKNFCPLQIEYDGKLIPVSVEMKKQAVFNLYACGKCIFEISKAENWKDFMIGYANFKAATYKKLSDFGAFADLTETVVHLIACRENWRVQIKNLHVSAVGHVDVTIDGKNVEVGTNGKSWLESTESDSMNGRFDSVLYGVFTEEKKASICALFEDGQVEKAVKVIANSLYYFSDKYDFKNFMNNVGRSSSLVWKKAGYFQTVYNGSKHGAFLSKVEQEKIPTLAEYMHVLGKNDFC